MPSHLVPGATRAAAAALLVALVATGCGAAPDTAPRVDPIATGATTSSSPASGTAPDTTAEREAGRRATAVVRAWFPTVYRLLGDPALAERAAERRRIGRVADGLNVNAIRNDVVQMYATGDHAVGAVVVRSTTVTAVDLSPKQPEDAVVRPYVVVDVCTDASGYRIVDREGRAVPTEDGPTRRIFTMTVTDTAKEGAKTSRWRVTNQERTQRPC